MANDSKYGRVYPERAVGPLLETARRLLDPDAPAGPEADDLLESALDDLDELGFPEDEPIFVLRGQDSLAAEAVRLYCNMVMLSQAFGGRGSEEQMAMVKHLRDFADRMERWQPRKLPD